MRRPTDSLTTERLALRRFTTDDLDLLVPLPDPLLAAIATLVDAAESALAGDPAASQAAESILRGEINVLRAAAAYSKGNIQSARQTERTLERSAHDLCQRFGIAVNLGQVG